MFQGFKFTEGLAQMTWFLQVLWFVIIHLLCACSSYLYYIECITYWWKLRSTVSLLFKNSFLVEIIYLLIKFNKTNSFLWNTKNTDRNYVNEQIKQTTYERKITLERGNVRGIQISVINFSSYLGNVLYQLQVKKLQN